MSLASLLPFVWFQALYRSKLFCVARATAGLHVIANVNVVVVCWRYSSAWTRAVGRSYALHSYFFGRQGRCCDGYC